MMNLMWAFIVCAGITLVTSLFLAALPDAKNVHMSEESRRVVGRIALIFFLATPSFGILAALAAAAGM